MTVDFFLIPLSFAFAALFWSSGAAGGITQTLGLVGIMSVSGVIASIALGLPRMKLNAYEQSGIQRTAAYGAIVGAAGAIVSSTLLGNPVDLQFILVVTMALMILSVSTRLLMRNMLIRLYRSGHTRKRVLIYGAGQTGVQLAAALESDDTVEPMAFIDDNPTLQKVLVAGRPVYPPVRIRKIIEELSIDLIVLAMPANSRPKQARLAQHLKSMGCEVSMLPSFATIVGSGKLQDKIQPANPSEFLGRDGLDADLAGVAIFISTRAS